MKKSKKVLFYSDQHSGNVWGLTPDKYQTGDEEKYQSALYDWFVAKQKAIGTVDYAVNVGDAVDGDCRRSAIDSLSVNIEKQINMAVESIRDIKAKEYFFVQGTPYHTSGSSDYERAVAEKFDAWCGDELPLSVNGKTFHAIHTTSKTSIPHGQGLHIKGQLWSVVNQAIAGEKIFDFEMRGHVHERFFAETEMGVVDIIPCLCWGKMIYARKYGKNGYYRMGMTLYTIHGDGTWEREKFDFNSDLNKKRMIIR